MQLCCTSHEQLSFDAGDYVGAGYDVGAGDDLGGM